MKLLKRESMSGKAEEIERLIKALRIGSDDQTSTILARLRIGDDITDILKGLPSSISPPTVGEPSRYAKSRFIPLLLEVATW
jgi:hypothetical protein